MHQVKPFGARKTVRCCSFVTASAKTNSCIRLQQLRGDVTLDAAAEQTAGEIEAVGRRSACIDLPDN